MMSCTKSKEVHPEIGDGNDEIITVGVNDLHVVYFYNNMEAFEKVYFCYRLASTSEDPQYYTRVEMSKLEDRFELTLTNLFSDTLYRYYYLLIDNLGGTDAYTESKTFRTRAFVQPEPPAPPTPQDGVPEGAIDGLFTINDIGDQVYFSQGNLQYQASTNTWRFAENQWDYIGTQTPDENGNYGGTMNGNDNCYISQSYSGWIDLFGWGTSGYNHGANAYQPWSDSENDDDYYAYGHWMYTLYDQTGQADWGYNTIINGGNTENIGWRTLSYSELFYIINRRTTPSGYRWTSCKVNGINGIILFPDNWTASLYTLNSINGGFDGENIINLEDWLNIFEANGAVFLPAAGDRYNGMVLGAGHYCRYWTSTSYGFDSAKNLNYSMMDTYLDMDFCIIIRSVGHSVRLVQNAN